ncbi:hypothetical protein CDD83_11176 [Cordyceps sp. RAO-2017]|nr:hypothetical protein CDD83_11176 [Cordyceps sp. RAO-2017]
MHIPTQTLAYSAACMAARQACILINFRREKQPPRRAAEARLSAPVSGSGGLSDEMEIQGPRPKRWLQQLALPQPPLRGPGRGILPRGLDAAASPSTAYVHTVCVGSTNVSSLCRILAYSPQTNGQTSQTDILSPTMWPLDAFSARQACTVLNNGRLAPVQVVVLDRHRPTWISRPKLV